MRFLLRNYSFRPVFNLRKLGGQVYGRRPYYLDGEEIHVSPPIKLNGNILTTMSGSQYELVDPLGDEAQIHAEILKVIERGSYETYQ
jgi:hypothetical protein